MKLSPLKRAGNNLKSFTSEGVCSGAGVKEVWCASVQFHNPWPTTSADMVCSRAGGASLRAKCMEQTEFTS